MTSVIRTRRGVGDGRRLYIERQQGAARSKGRLAHGRKGRKPQRALTRSEITSGEGFGFRNRPS